jgi:hypothetical protein
MWVLVVIVMVSGSLAIDHIDGFSTYGTCSEAGREMETRAGIPGTVKTHCFQKR